MRSQVVRMACVALLVVLIGCSGFSSPSNDTGAPQFEVIDESESLTYKPVQKEVEIAPGVNMMFCWIPPGRATLGSPVTEEGRFNEKEHEYTSKGYWLAKYECTQEQWQAVMGSNPSHFDGEQDNKARGMDTKRFPVEQVSWDDISGKGGFLEKVNEHGKAASVLGKGRFALPHEDEWEYACRGGKGNRRPFYWGNVLKGDKANHCGQYPYGTVEKGEYLDRPTPVGSYERKAPHPWGLCDMSGNVYEWCDDGHAGDPSDRAMRGGSFYVRAEGCRSASRNGFNSSCVHWVIGFRLIYRPE